MNWTSDKYHIFWKNIYKEKDKNYIDFLKKTVNTNYKIMGIRTPLLRKKASFIAKENIQSYLKVVKDETYEEVLMQGFVIGKLKNREEVANFMTQFVPKIDNWAICDMTVASLKIVNQEKDYFLPFIDHLLESDALYARRLGLVLLINYYVEDEFLEKIFKRILKTKGEEYYIDMAKAWLLCECFIKNQEKTYSFLENEVISFSILTKTVQKVCDSYRVSPLEKEKLKKLRAKKRKLYS